MSKKESVFWIVCGVALTAIVLYLAPRARGEEIRTLPNDENKWYVSVVGDANDAGYQKVLAWFDSGDLKDLKDQTHFNAVTIDSPMYPHYQVNGTKLPFVRVQTADGAVVYEAAGAQMPWSAQALYGAIASAAGDNQKMVLRRRHRERQQEPNVPEPNPIPKPDVPKIVVKVDPPAPPLDNGRNPIFRRVREAINAFNVAVLCIVAVSTASASVYGG